jgi:hypothetical protein
MIAFQEVVADCGDFNEVYVGRNILVLMNGNNGK